MSQVELTLKEAEVIKISPMPGDVLFFKFKGDQFMEDDVNNLGAQLRKMFPANKVVVMALPSGHDVELTTVQEQAKVKVTQAQDCSQPTAYCNSCACGKKERILAAQGKGDAGTKE